jgi:hypothetical protein
MRTASNGRFPVLPVLMNNAVMPGLDPGICWLGPMDAACKPVDAGRPSGQARG